MKQVYAAFLRTLYWLTWPISGLLLHNSSRVRIVVQSGSHLLLLKSSFGQQEWSLPGGGIKKQELALNAAVRELEEETGILVTNKQLKKLGEMRLPSHRNWPQSNITFFSVKLPTQVAPQPLQPLEILDIAWFKISQLPTGLSKTVDHGLAFLKK